MHGWCPSEYIVLACSIPECVKPSANAAAASRRAGSVVISADIEIAPS
jgi:hypothetical protein